MCASHRERASSSPASSLARPVSVPASASVASAASRRRTFRPSRQLVELQRGGARRPDGRARRPRGCRRARHPRRVRGRRRDRPSPALPTRWRPPRQHRATPRALAPGPALDRAPASARTGVPPPVARRARAVRRSAGAEIGRNSVRPWTRPSITASSQLTGSPPQPVSGSPGPGPRVALHRARPTLAPRRRPTSSS